MAFNGILDSELDPDAPLTSSLAYRGMRDNLKASFDGDAGATKLSTIAMVAPASGTTNFIIKRHTQVEDITTDTSYPASGSGNIGNAIVAGSVRVAVDHKVDGGTGAVRILKNGTQEQEWTTSSGSYVTRSVDITITIGDSIEVQHRAAVGFESFIDSGFFYSSTKNMAIS